MLVLTTVINQGINGYIQVNDCASFPFNYRIFGFVQKIQAISCLTNRTTKMGPWYHWI